MRQGRPFGGQRLSHRQPEGPARLLLMRIRPERDLAGEGDAHLAAAGQLQPALQRVPGDQVGFGGRLPGEAAPKAHNTAGGSASKNGSPPSARSESTRRPRPRRRHGRAWRHTRQPAGTPCAAPVPLGMARGAACRRRGQEKGQPTTIHLLDTVMPECVVAEWANSWDENRGFGCIMIVARVASSSYRT